MHLLMQQPSTDPALLALVGCVLAATVLVDLALTGELGVSGQTHDYEQA